jgi:hypothetical protein
MGWAIFTGGGWYRWRHPVTSIHSRTSRLIDINGDGSPLMSINMDKEFVPSAIWVGLFFQLLSPPRLDCHCCFDSGKQWQSNLGGDENWKNRTSYRNGERSISVSGLWSNTRSGKPSPLMSINIERSPFSCVGRFFQFSSPPKLLCHCLPESKPSPVLR